MSDENKPKNRFELHQERLATTDELGQRIYLYPEDVEGFWKKYRTRFYWILIAIYMITPWIYLKGKPLILLDLRHREFTFFGNTFFGVEPLIIFLALAAGLFFIAFMTSLFGRVWCGWACPQTVYIQTLFQGIEKFIEGSARKRKELDDGPWTTIKFLKKILKWTLFTLLSLHITHTFAGYFVGPRELLMMSLGNPTENWGVFSGVMIFTGIILFDFGWFREQFCIIACPYGRMQSVMMDENSLVVAYDTKRGEPRRGAAPKENEGDCINCYHCVKVCPTGIDIRRGTQLECIACTNCIDACDEIMEKIHKPKGLIRYSSENELQGKTTKKITTRSIIYIFISLIFVTAFFTVIMRSTNLSVQMIRNIGAPYSVTKNELVLNMYSVKLVHQGEKKYKISIEADLKEVEVVTPKKITALEKHEMKIPVFFKFPQEILDNGTKVIKLQFFDGEDLKNRKLIQTLEVSLVGPITK